ncbi:GNAT family N-acetyltransferase [Neolewinella persica]|uniref:GNAT family N-acetyltransferase n=1 Tax=Neolewinella persica TaxID=70998 RepID=UPI0003684F5C|nr:GNAT family N-acetyltransferase [Neolewinella persica]
MANRLQFVPYTPAHAKAWFDLNEAWISENFTMEDSDYASLRDPQGYFLDQDGHILIAEYDGEPVGTGGLLKMEHSTYDYELAKMCISPKVQGRGFGLLLGQALLHLAKELGATSVYLESNDKLASALRLYQKLGFEDVDGRNSPYARCNVKMAIAL